MKQAVFDPSKVTSDLGTANKMGNFAWKGVTSLVWREVIKKTTRYRLRMNVNIRTPISNIPAYYSPL